MASILPNNLSQRPIPKTTFSYRACFCEACNSSPYEEAELLIPCQATCMQLSDINLQTNQNQKDAIFSFFPLSCTTYTLFDTYSHYAKLALEE